jgi:hypothetical protein
MNFNSFLFSITFFICACSNLPENRIELKNATFYFEYKKDYHLTKKIALFWKENNLIGEKKQHIKVETKNSQLSIYLIASENINPNLLSFEHQKLLMEITTQLDSMFHEKFETSILICNKYFEPQSKIGS